jgi:hypothetical protein
MNKETLNELSNAFTNSMVHQVNFWLNKDKNNQFFLLKFIQGERIQLFYEDVDLYFPFDIYKFNKIE